MANSDLSLNIGTSFDGAGLKKLDSALKDTSKQAKTATDTISKISGAVSGIDGSVGKVAGNLTRVFQAFAQGGLIGVAIAGVTTVVGACISKFNELQEHARAVGQAIKDNIVKSMQAVVDKAGEAMKAFDKQQAFNRRLDGKANSDAVVNNSIAANTIRQQHIQNRAALGDDELAIQRDAAKERLELAKQEAEAKKQAAESRVAEAQKELQGEQERLKLIEKERAELAEKHHEIYSMEGDYVKKMTELLSYRKYYEQQGDSKGVADVDVRIGDLKKDFGSSAKNIQGVNEAVVNGLKKWEEQTDKIIAAQINLEIETKKMEGAEVDYKTALMAAEETYNTQIKSIEKREQVEQERLQKQKEVEEARINKENEAIAAEQKKIEIAEQRAQLEEERNQKIQESKQYEDELNAQTKKLADEIKNKQAEIAAFQLQNINDGTKNLDDIRRERRKAEIQNQKIEDRKDRVRQQAEDKVKDQVARMTDKDGRLLKGNENNMPWLDRAIKDAAAAGVSNEKLNSILGENFRNGLERQKADLLAKVTNKEGEVDASKLSPQNREKLDRLNQILDASEDKKGEIENLKEKQQMVQSEKEANNDRLATLLEQINNKMDNLGL